MRPFLTRRAFGGLALASALGPALPLAAQGGARVLPRPADLPDDLQFSFAALSLEDGRRWLLEGSRMDTRVVPYSTFKIPNTLIGLAQGVITGIDHVRSRNVDLEPARPGWPESWLEDQDLASAFGNSVAWYYSQIAREIGATDYGRALRAFRYGNADAGFANDRFWLDGTLLISPAEQLGFLARLVAGYLDVPEAHLAILDQISRDGEVAGQALHGKTGMGDRVDNRGAGGWYVGWVGTRPSATVFALYCEGAGFDAIRDRRRETAERLLNDALSGS